jgi:hypothetical protein
VRRLIMLICVDWLPTVHVFVAGLPLSRDCDRQVSGCQ